EALVLARERVLRLPQNLRQRVDRELVARDDDRQAPHELGDHAVFDEILGARLRAQRVLVVVGGADGGAEAEAALPDATADDVLDPVERAGADEEDVGRVDLDELLLRPVARAVGRDGRGLALEDLEERLLHALARDVARRRRHAALARDLVDLVDADDAARGALDVAAGVAVERLDHRLHVLADVAGLGQRGRVGDGEGDVELAGERLREERLAAAGRSEEHDVALLDLDLGGLAAHPDALVVVVDGDGERLLRARLSDDVAIELGDDFLRCGVLRTLGGLFLGEDVVAQPDALVADEDPRPGDELAHLASTLAAERAVEIVHLASIVTQWELEARAPDRARS